MNTLNWILNLKKIMNSGWAWDAVWQDVKIKVDTIKRIIPQLLLRYKFDHPQVASPVWHKKLWFSQLPKKSPNIWATWVIKFVFQEIPKIAQSGHTGGRWRWRRRRRSLRRSLTEAATAWKLHKNLSKFANVEREGGGVRENRIV